VNDLRKRIEAEFDLPTAEPVWLELYETAAATCDTIRDLEALIASDGMLSTGSKGQVTIHPAVAELRTQRAAYARLLIQLGIAGDDQRRDRAQRASRKRWDR
jgi:hypothetical protein